MLSDFDISCTTDYFVHPCNLSSEASACYDSQLTKGIAICQAFMFTLKQDMYLKTRFVKFQAEEESIPELKEIDETIDQVKASVERLDFSLK